MFGYWDGPKSDSNKRAAHSALDSLSSWLKSQPNRQSFKYQNGNIIAYMWSGSMVQNSGLDANIIALFKDEVDNNGIPNLAYVEYVNGDPTKGFGIAIETTGGTGVISMQRAVRLWSQRKSFNTKTGSKLFNSKPVCYLSYSNRKPIQNNEEAGNCEYIIMKSGMDLAKSTGVNGESLQGYNPKLDFTKLQEGQPICYSEGKAPNFKPNKKSIGSCKVYKVNKGESCSSISAKYYPLSVDDIINYNKNNFGWKGCDNIQFDYNLNISDASTPRR